VRDDGAQCWEATYSLELSYDGIRLKARSDP
jgi:hypothetical protein